VAFRAGAVLVGNELEWDGEEDNEKLPEARHTPAAPRSDPPPGEVDVPAAATGGESQALDSQHGRAGPNSHRSTEQVDSHRATTTREEAPLLDKDANENAFPDKDGVAEASGAVQRPPVAPPLPGSRLPPLMDGAVSPASQSMDVSMPLSMRPLPDVKMSDGHPNLTGGRESHEDDELDAMVVEAGGGDDLC